MFFSEKYFWFLRLRGRAGHQHCSLCSEWVNVDMTIYDYINAVYLTFNHVSNLINCSCRLEIFFSFFSYSFNNTSICWCAMIYLRSGLWTKTLASSVLSIILMAETCTGCCRSSLSGLVMNMKFVSLEQMFRKLTNVVSTMRNEE